MNNVDKEYFRLLRTILTDGKTKHNRTGVDTIGIFGEMAKFQVDLKAFPILLQYIQYKCEEQNVKTEFDEQGHLIAKISKDIDV